MFLNMHTKTVSCLKQKHIVCIWKAYVVTYVDDMMPPFDVKDGGHERRSDCKPLPGWSQSCRRVCSLYFCIFLDAEEFDKRPLSLLVFRFLTLCSMVFYELCICCYCYNNLSFYSRILFNNWIFIYYLSICLSI